MKPALVSCLVPLLLAGCTTPGTGSDSATRLIPSGPEPEQVEAGFDRAALEKDLLVTARARLGEPLVRRALAADAYIFAKYYPGMIPPPPPGTRPDWRPTFPFALLFRDAGQWQVASASGTRAAAAETVSQIEALLADPAFWRQPNWTHPRCTDAGASLLLVKLPPRPESLRRGSCGETERTERLVQLALKA